MKTTLLLLPLLVASGLAAEPQSIRDALNLDRNSVYSQRWVTGIYTFKNMGYDHWLAVYTVSPKPTGSEADPKKPILPGTVIVDKNGKTVTFQNVEFAIKSKCLLNLNKDETSGDLVEGTVLYNIAEISVKVGDVELKTGESAVFKGKKFIKLKTIITEPKKK